MPGIFRHRRHLLENGHSNSTDDKKTPPEIESIHPFGGNLWSVTFKPTEIERILNLGGEVCFVHAKDEQDAIEKAKRKYIHRRCR